MFENSPLLNKNCQPLVAYCGRGARLNFKPDNFSHFYNFNFDDINSVFKYDIKICKFDSKLFFNENASDFAFLIETSIKSSSQKEDPFEDVNVFLEENFDDLVEYSIILPRMFKKHQRYVLDLERDNCCSFENFTDKVELWKNVNGIA